MFSIGDLVVHPMHGAGMIDDIVLEKIAGVKKEYYVFKMPAGGLVLKIPVATSQMIGLRGSPASRKGSCLPGKNRPCGRVPGQCSQGRRPPPAAG